MKRLLSKKSSYIFDLQLQNIENRSHVETQSFFFYYITKAVTDLEIPIKNNKLDVEQRYWRP